MISVSVKNIRKNYGETIALHDISFEVGKGELFGFIGSDGAGKTTLFRILTTLILPDKGSATLEGYDVIKDYKQIRNILGYMPGKFSLYQDLSVEENLNFFATIFGTTLHENYDLIKEIYGQIEPFKTRKAGKLSGGMKQKLALSCALIHKPVVLILDEPTNHLDLESITALNRGLDKFHGTILFSSHDHELVQTVANRIIEVTPRGYIDRISTTFDEYLANEQIKEQRHELYKLAH